MVNFLETIRITTKISTHVSSFAHVYLSTKFYEIRGVALRNPADRQTVRPAVSRRSLNKEPLGLLVRVLLQTRCRSFSSSVCTQQWA